MWTKRRQFSSLIILVKNQEMQGVFVVVVVLFIFLKVCQKDGLWTNQNIKLHASSRIRKIYDLNIWLSCTYIFVFLENLVSCLFIYLFCLFLFSVAVCLLCWIVCLSVYFFVCLFISDYLFVCLFVCLLTISCRLTYNSLPSGLPKWG